MSWREAFFQALCTSKALGISQSSHCYYGNNKIREKTKWFCPRRLERWRNGKGIITIKNKNQQKNIEWDEKKGMKNR